MSELATSFMDQRRKRELDDAFPEVDPGETILGGRVLVQLRRPKTKTAGGIILSEYSKETEGDVNTVALVRQVGPVAFCDKRTNEPWPEGQWLKPGDYCRVPRYGGFRIKVPMPGEVGEFVEFAVFNDNEMITHVQPERALAALSYV